jgi:hypothetical protein
VPQCILAFVDTKYGSISPTNCALICDPDGTASRCPAGATCKSLYKKNHLIAGVPDMGICTYDAPSSYIQA